MGMLVNHMYLHCGRANLVEEHVWCPKNYGLLESFCGYLSYLLSLES